MHGGLTSFWQAKVPMCFALAMMGRTCPAQTEPAAQPSAQHQGVPLPEAPGMSMPGDAESTAAMQEEADAEAREPGEADTVRGTVTNRDGVAIENALVVLRFMPAAGSAAHGERAERTGVDGSFDFHGVPAGAFTVQVSRADFVTRLVSGKVAAGQAAMLAQILMVEKAAGADALVTTTLQEMATEQMKLEEKQRVFGVFPNFYISYLPNAAPLSKRNKWNLAYRSALDPVSFALIGVSAGIEQATDAFSGYGQGASGYAKRYGAGLGDDVISTALGGAVFPILFKQDPRYFWKGTGTTRMRAVYAVTRVVVAKGDNGRWQPNYSNVLGNLVSAGISNAYYPASDRNGAGLTFLNLALGTGAGALANLYQEFFSRRMTPAAERMPAQGLEQQPGASAGGH